MKNILVLYYSKGGSTKKMAEQVAMGVEKAGAEAILRTVPEISACNKQTQESIPTSGAIFVCKEDIANCDGIIVGSPAYFGNMAAVMKYFFDSNSSIWFEGLLIDKPVAFFTSVASMHAGHESTILSMMIPFLHNGCVIVGVPYNIPALSKTTAGGSPYGATHHNKGENKLTQEESDICKALGERVVRFVR